jgi:hypothetical protein
VYSTAKRHAVRVEFVLGGRRNEAAGGRSGRRQVLEGSDVWLLDFSLCTVFDVGSLVKATKLDDLVEQLVVAFFSNDPYYPRPRPGVREGQGVENEEETLRRRCGKRLRLCI